LSVKYLSGLGLSDSTEGLMIKNRHEPLRKGLTLESLQLCCSCIATG
jgi:hypothetical protein